MAGIDVSGIVNGGIAGNPGMPNVDFGGFDWSSLGQGALDFLGNNANMIGGMATAQRIPGQTTAGEYTPTGNSVGSTYNYIPTGASQLDPRLIQMMLGGQNPLSGASSQYWQTAPGVINAGQGGLSYLFDPATTQALQQWAGTAAGSANNAANWAGGQADELANTATGQRDFWNGIVNNIGNNQYIQGAQAGAGAIGSAYGGAGQGNTALGSQLQNLYSQFGQNALQNPFNMQQLGGAQQAGGMLQNAGQGAFGAGQNLTGTANAGLPAAMSVLNTAFDPQNDLYNRSAQKLNDQLGVYMANSGLTGSGAGAGIASDALRNFNIDWQNNQLGRQAQGLQAFNQGVYSTGQNLGSGYNLQTGGAGNVATGAGLPATTYNAQTGQQLGTLGQLGGGYQTAANLQTTGLGQQAYGNTYGADVFNQYMLNPLETAQQGYGNFLGQMGNAYSTAGNLRNDQTQNLMNTGALPYNAAQTIGGNQTGALNNFLNTGQGLSTASGYLNNQNIQQMLQYLQAVTQGSQNAAYATKNVAGTTNAQNASSGAGAGSLISSALKFAGPLLLGLL